MKDRGELDFVMSFVESSQRYKDQFVSKWQEILASFLVQPDYAKDGNSTSPYERRGETYQRRRAYGIRDSIILKDPQTHQIVMTYAAKIVKAIFGDNKREFVQARPVGWEDAQVKAPEVTKLLRYCFNLPGHYRTMVESVIDMLIFGTSVIEVSWRYEEREVPIRTVTSVGPIEFDSETRAVVPVYDDVCLRVIAPEDFFPDPSQYRIGDMKGVAKKFKMTKLYAEYLARNGFYNAKAVENAISYGEPSSPERDSKDSWRIDQPDYRAPISDFGEMIGYEYWGDVPWVDELGSSRKVITVLNDVVVRNVPYPLTDYALPFHTMIINPVAGRFYGISPAEVVRFDQSFADAIKMLVAEAIIRDVHPPLAIDSNAADIDVAALKQWRPDAPIMVAGGPQSVGTLRYAANFPAAFNVQAQLTQSMQGASGALGGIQGEPGPDREAASVGMARFSAAMDRPELAALVIENECLPPIGKAIIKRYQQFLDTDGLKKRIGELPENIWIGDIMADFDIEFIGTRQQTSRQMKLQAFDRLVAYANTNPGFAYMLPQDKLAAAIVGDWLELPELIPSIGTTQTIAENMIGGALAGRPGMSGNANGAVPSMQPAGMLPAQAAGNEYAK